MTATTLTRPPVSDWILGPTRGAARARVAIVLGSNALFLTVLILTERLSS